VIEKNDLRIVQFARLQTWSMSFICGLLAFLAVAAATRLPYYLATQDYARLAGLALFGLVVLAGMIDNVRTHLCLWRLQSEITTGK
jgi:hypothetical protein